MTTQQYLEILWNDSPNPCYFVDVETQELVFINHTYKKKFQIFEDYTGKKCWEVLEKATGTCALCTGKSVSSDDFLEHRVFSEALNSHLRSKSTIIEVFGRKLLLSKFFLTAADERRIIATHSFDEAITDCLELLALQDKDQSIQSLLELLGKFYACETTYIYEFDETSQHIQRGFVWSAKDEVAVEPEDSEGVDAFLEWVKLDKEMVNIESLREIPPERTRELEFFKRYGISNITLSKIWNTDGSLRGIVGMNNRISPLLDNRLLRAISFFVSERVNEASVTRALKNLNETDLLTGFFNRNKYAERLAEVHDNPPKALGVLFINLNGLRRTNEYFGFEVGDAQIKNTSEILRESFQDDFFRISGDEFVAFIADIQEEVFEQKIATLYEKLKTEHTESSFALGHAWKSGAYLVSDLVKTADTFMTINKQAFYSENFKENEEVSSVLLQDLLRAIAEEEFLVYLQPQLDLKSENIVGAEALIRRIDKKQNKMIFPDQFIPLYERNSIIRHVDLFVVRKVCQLLKEWNHFGKQLPISVNLSRVTLLEHNIVQTISKILDEYKTPHELIIIEITERIGLVENDVATTLVDEFKAEGFKLSLDDFGCAYSNIITLAQIAVDEVKIDKSLVDNLLTSEKNRVIVKNMLTMCNELEETSTLAEGIETEEQAQFLRDSLCYLGQGYLYSRPIPNEEFFEKYIKI